MQRASQSLFTMMALMLTWGVAACGVAGTYRFDLTDLVEPGTDFALKRQVDLGIAFKHIDGASIEIEGVFTPGLMQPVTISGDGPLVPTDTTMLSVVMGDPGTPFYLTPARTWQDMHGQQGNVSFQLPLLAPVISDEPIFQFNPPLVGNPDFSFLLDGEFELSAGSSHFVASLYQVIESPRFEVTSLVLEITGTAVPEPTSLVLVLGGIGAVVAIQRNRQLPRARPPISDP